MVTDAALGRTAREVVLHAVAGVDFETRPSSRWNGIEKMIWRDGWVRIARIAGLEVQ